MERYVAVDSGKFATKVAEYDQKNNCLKNSFQIRTKVSEGDFRDDAIEKCTVIAEIDSVVYKIGNGARGEGAELDTNKKSDIHKICLMTALATLASSNEVDEFNVAIGYPAKLHCSVKNRFEYKEYMFPEGEISVSIKQSSTSPVVKKTFKIKNSFVYPESIGALFMDETLYDITDTTITGVIDIGNLNLNATLWQGTNYNDDKSATVELGGTILIQELSQELSSNITYCDELITANILKTEPSMRTLTGKNLTPEQVELSKTIISKVLREHAEKVKRTCRQRNWSLDVTNIIAIGGTSEDIKAELEEVFGNITILPNSTFCNVYGYLRMMCNTLLGTIIPLTLNDTKSKKEK